MRKEMIVSYEEEEGRKVRLQYEGDLIRCENCVRYRCGSRGSYCMGRRTSPRGHCDRAVLIDSQNR